MRRSPLLLVLALAFAFSCGSKKDKDQPPAEPAQEQGAGEEAAEPECEVDDDCRGGYMCLDGQCTSTKSGDIYRNPQEAVTPEKVKREVEKRMKQGEERLDRGLEMDE